MSMGSKDVSKRDALLSRKRTNLEQKINSKVYETQSLADEYQQKAVQDLNIGLGLLSNYIDKRIEAQKGQTDLYTTMNDSVIPSLYAQAREGASFILDNLGKTYGK